MENKRKKYLSHITSNNGEFVSCLIIIDNLRYNLEGGAITYNEPIPEYHLDKYNASKSYLTTTTLTPID